ncbi:MAG: hypothetical protein H7A46_12360 [Verrucomicrobiales bacterium]|nr:hypothetical protein [Verrucomicrobiales bacterium]
MRHKAYKVTPLLALLAFAVPASGQESVVEGVVRVERAKVLTTGAKSDKEVVVSLEPLETKPIPPPQKRVEMDQRGMVFLPHVMTVQVGRTVAFLNSDNDRHNVYFLFEKTGDTLDIGTWGPGQTVTHVFKEPGVVVTLCQLHLEMAAYILVFDHPFHTVAEIRADTQTATFKIPNVPPGRYQVNAWHKRLKLKGQPVPLVVQGDRVAVPDLVITKKQYAK